MFFGKKWLYVGGSAEEAKPKKNRGRHFAFPGPKNWFTSPT
jgi:hypothetical protein